MNSSVVLKSINGDFSLSDHTYRVLRDAVLDMDVYAEDATLKLDERKMAEQLGVSRTPIREALGRLEQEGFVQIRPRKGIYILRKSLTDVLEMITVWAALESMAARLACENASADDIASLRAIAETYSVVKARANLIEYSEANIEFHRTVLRISGCKKLVELGEDVFAHLKPIRRRAMKDTRRADRSVADHMTIIEAIEARQPDQASDQVRRHTMRLHDYIEQTWEDVTGPRMSADIP